MASAFVEGNGKDVDRILDDVTRVYERLTGERYAGPREGEAAATMPPGVDGMEVLQQEYRYLMGLVNSGTLRSPFTVPYVWSPPAEVLVTPKEILVRLDLPGVEKTDIFLSIHNGQVLLIKGERRFRRAAHEVDHVIMEKTYGQFTKQIPLPDKVDTGSVEARLEEGVLELRLPRVHAAPELEEREIKIR